jgi:hypothetical protein
MSFQAVISVAELATDIGLIDLDVLVLATELSFVTMYCRNPGCKRRSNNPSLKRPDIPVAPE